MTTTLLKRFRNGMMRVMARVMPSCKEISQLISASMDEKLPLRKRLSIRFHLLMCNLCRRYEEQLHLLRTGTQSCAKPKENKTEVSLSQEARERLERKLASER